MFSTHVLQLKLFTNNLRKPLKDEVSYHLHFSPGFDSVNIDSLAVFKQELIWRLLQGIWPELVPVLIPVLVFPPVPVFVPELLPLVEIPLRSGRVSPHASAFVFISLINRFGLLTSQLSPEIHETNSSNNRAYFLK